MKSIVIKNIRDTEGYYRKYYLDMDTLIHVGFVTPEEVTTMTENEFLHAACRYIEVYEDGIDLDSLDYADIDTIY